MNKEKELDKKFEETLRLSKIKILMQCRALVLRDEAPVPENCRIEGIKKKLKTY